MAGKSNRLIIALTILLTASLAASAQTTDYGTRAYGMGGAYTGVASDLSALIYNPAGLTMNTFEVSLSVGSNDLSAITALQGLFDDPTSLDEDASLNVAVLSGASLGRFGGGLAFDGSVNVSTSCPGGIEICASGESMMQIMAGMGYDVAALPGNLAGLQLGVSLKRLDGRRLEYEREPAVGTSYNATTRSWRGKGFSATLGGTVQLTPMLTLGVAAQDILSSISWEGTEEKGTYSVTDNKPIGSTITSDLDPEKTKLDPTLRVGAAFRPPVLGLTIAADVATDGTMRYGVEKSFLFGLLAFRAGQIKLEETTTTTLGLGVNFGPIHFDAGLRTSDGFKSVGTMVEGSMRF